MNNKENNTIIKKQQLLLKARVALACGQIDLLFKVEEELSLLNNN